jgi:hypothetical protein
MKNILLDKFNNVTVDPRSLVGQEDQQAILKIESRYQQLRENLEAWKYHLNELATKIPHSYDYYSMKTNERWDRSKYFSINIVDLESNDWASRLMFSPAYSLIYIEETLQKIRLERNKALITYFSERYHLSFTINDKEDDSFQNVSDVIDFLVIKNDGRGFTEAGIMNVIDKLKKLFWKPTLAKDKIVFPKSCIHDTYRPQIDVHSNAVKALANALILFETGELNKEHQGISSFLRDYNNPIQIGTMAKCESSLRFTGLRLYKNKRLELFFCDQDTAKDFYNMFKLDEIK